MDIVFELLHIEIGIGSQIDLVDEDQIGGLEQQRILQGLVVALGDGGHADADMLAQPEFCGADQIADVVDDDGLHAGQVQLRNGLLDHVGLQVAGTLGVQLDGPDAQGGHALGVLGGVEVALDDRHGAAVDAAVGQDLLQEGGLAAAGGSQQIHHPDATAVQVGPDQVGDLVVLIEYVYIDGNGFHIILHGNS